VQCPTSVWVQCPVFVWVQCPLSVWVQCPVIVWVQCPVIGWVQCPYPRPGVQCPRMKFHKQLGCKGACQCFQASVGKSAPGSVASSVTRTCFCFKNKRQHARKKQQTFVRTMRKHPPEKQHKSALQKKQHARKNTLLVSSSYMVVYGGKEKALHPCKKTLNIRNSGSL
jgi:hypothetical protein